MEIVSKMDNKSVRSQKGKLLEFVYQIPSLREQVVQVVLRALTIAKPFGMFGLLSCHRAVCETQKCEVQENS